MHYIDFQGEKLPRLGFGTMRLPTGPDRSIRTDETEDMVRYAMEHGVNYFDTAYPYHDGKSELVIGNALKKYAREDFLLADKYPGHQVLSEHRPGEIFEEQLEKCGVGYFDFYMLHNVCEFSMNTYLDERWRIIPYFIEQKRRGRIRHLGFSSHARPETLAWFLDRYGKDMEFCQIQLNYLDWTLQNAKEKVEILNVAGVPIWVMEPLRGGKLACLPEEMSAGLRAARRDESDAAWAFRFLQGVRGVYVTLSGMSDLPQMKENVKTFEEEQPLSEEETELLLRLAEGLKSGVPCTACRYCCEGCPAQLDIPMLLHAYNETRAGGGLTVPMQLDALPEDKLPSACIGCRSCESICPQGIEISRVMRDLTEIRKTLPNWREICRQREEAARRARQK